MVRQELWCHGCERYVQFDMEEDLNGDLTVICPNCGHEHYRKVENGVITEVRWASSGGSFIISGNMTSTVSMYTTSSSTTCTFTFTNWANTTVTS